MREKGKTHMKNIEINTQELERTRGGLTWNQGFLLGITPLGTLSVLVGFGVWLASGYDDYLKGLDEGIKAANKQK